jgi:two-component system cell cycle response regulator
MLTILFRETDRVQRMHNALCLILFDIDDFVYWNRELGWDACDGLLQEIVRRAGRMLRSYDLLGRMGKDKFLLALPGCSMGSAMMLAERLRSEVFGESFMAQSIASALLTDPSRDEERINDRIPVRLTACFGVASSGGRSPVVVMREVEQALAFAKQSGPDWVRSASESPMPAESSVEFAFPSLTWMDGA